MAETVPQVNLDQALTQLAQAATRRVRNIYLVDHAFLVDFISHFLTNLTFLVLLSTLLTIEGINPIHSPLVSAYFDILHLPYLLRNINTAMLLHYIWLER